MLKNSNINMMQNANLVLSKYAHSKKVLTVFVSVVKNSRYAILLTSVVKIHQLLIKLIDYIFLKYCSLGSLHF